MIFNDEEGTGPDGGLVSFFVVIVHESSRLILFISRIRRIERLASTVSWPLASLKWRKYFGR